LSTGGEQNTSGYKKSFVVGNCGSAGARMLAQEEGEQSEELSIHPNPVVDELYFNFGKSFEGGSLKIVTAIGKEEIVRQKVSSGKVNVSDLAPGLYILMVNKDQRNAMKRFVKK
jgi:hypothetical protein